MEAGTWAEWRVYVLKRLEDMRLLEGRISAWLSPKDQDDLVKEHREMYRWFWVLKIVIPMVVGALLAITVGVVTAFIRDAFS